MKHTFAVLAALMLGLPPTAAAQAQQVRYHVIQLTEIPSSGGCVPMAINDAGDVVGYCGAGEATPFAVLWRGGIVTDLGRHDSGTFSHAAAINALGQVVGDGDIGDIDPKALFHNGTRWIAIDTSGGSNQEANGITDDGVIFGNFTTQRHPGTETWDPVYWTYDAAHDRFDRHDLPKPPGTISGAFIYAVNRLGSAVGQVASDLVGNQAGFWNNDALHTLVVLGRPAGFVSAAAFGVSDDARAAGFAANASGAHAVLWLNDAGRTAVDLGTLAGDPEASAYAVNNTGQVVGVSTGPMSPLGAAERAFLYQDDVMKELTTLLDPADGAWTVSRAVGINNAGHIIGMGTQGGAQYAIILVPAVATCPSITIAVPDGPATFGAPFSLALSASGGVPPYAYALQDGALPSGLVLSTDGTITGTPAAAGDFTFSVAASDTGGCGGTAPVTVHVARATQTIVFAGLADRTFGDAPFRVSATGGPASSPVTFTAAGACSVAADMVSMSGAGSCAVTAAQTGDANYEAAMPVTQRFTIAQAVPVITWAAPADITLGTPLSATQLNATANVAGAFVYVPPIGTLLPLGTATLTVLFTPADAANYTTATAHVSVNVVSAAPPDSNPIVQPSDQMNEVGDRVKLWIFINGDLTRGRFDAANLPAGLVIDRRTGLIDGRIGKRTKGTYQVTVQFTQGGVTHSRTFTWTVR